MPSSGCPALQTHSPDYANMELEDFLARIENYLAVYQTMEEEHEGDMSFLKVLQSTQLNQLTKQIAFFHLFVVSV